MRKFYAMILAIVFVLTAANVAVLDNSKVTGYRITGESENYLEIDFNLKELAHSEIQTEKGVFTQLGIEQGFSSRTAGSPALPEFHELIAMPFGAEPAVEVVSFDSKVFKLSELGIAHPIIPAQPSYSKMTAPEDIKFVYNEDAYRVSKFAGEETASISKSGTMRGVGVGVLKVRPFKYNPAEGTIEVYNNLKVRVNYVNADPRAEEIKAESYSPYFESALQSLINYKPSTAKADLMSYPITYLILASDGLNGNADLQRLIDWKTEKGFNVIVNYTSSSSVDDTWVENQYSTLSPKPSFLLLVGDLDGTYTVGSNQSTPLGGSNVETSDLEYGVMGTVSSSNRIPSIYVGRFSVRVTGDLTAQVDKTIWYEKEQFTTGYNLDYLTYTLGVAGVDGSFAPTHGDPQISYGWTYYFNTANGMPNADYYLSDTSDNSTTEQEIVDFIAAGANFYNYTAHGMPTYFAEPEFTITDINGLNNANEYPLVVGNCCLTNTFNNAECFGEAWLNAADEGAIGYIGASMSTYWDEDLAMGVGIGDATVQGLTPPPLDISKPGMYDGVMELGYSSQAAIKHVGLMAVEASGSGFTDDYWGSYHLMGDPSVMIYFGIPDAMTASHDGIIAPVATTYTVTTTPYAYVAMGDQNGNLHGAARANSSGVAVVPISTYTVGDTGKLVITAQFKQPYFEDILCTGATGGTFALDHSSLNFGNVTVGGSSTLQFEISNSHNSEYLMGDITTITGYSVANAAKNILSYSVGPNSSKTFDLVFSPVAMTTYSGNITITSSDTNNDPVYISVTGTGAYPDINVAATTSATADIGGSVSDSFDIQNTGTAGLNYSLSNTYVGALVSGGTWAENDFSTFPGTGWTNSGWTSSSGAARASTRDTEVVLTSPSFDTSGATNPVYLDFTQNFYARTGSWTKVEYYTGSAWQQVYYATASTTTAQHIDLPTKSTSTQVRFTGYMTRSQAQTGYWDIDNVVVSAEEVPYSWLTFESPTTGFVASSGSNTINITYNASGLPEGDYEADITVASDDPDEPSEVVHVTFTVGGSTPPGAPENISVVTATSSEVDLSWDGVTGATIYHIYRSTTDPYSGFVLHDSSSGTSYQDNDVSAGNKYFYYITSDNAK